mmetsp:Transcript_84355/g.239113  ORF Transcript_84355/g.239113 Transcript_84355/m.239113 type:complete len:225 (-) Transcript_84355:219-893(-)
MHRTCGFGSESLAMVSRCAQETTRSTSSFSSHACSGSWQTAATLELWKRYSATHSAMFPRAICWMGALKNQPESSARLQLSRRTSSSSPSPSRSGSQAQRSRSSELGAWQEGWRRIAPAPGRQLPVLGTSADIRSSRASAEAAVPWFALSLAAEARAASLGSLAPSGAAAARLPAGRRQAMPQLISSKHSSIRSRYLPRWPGLSRLRPGGKWMSTSESRCFCHR